MRQVRNYDAVGAETAQRRDPVLDVGNLPAWIAGGVPDDEIGAANLITPESVMQAAKLVKTGKTYNLGMIIDPTVPAFAPRTMSLTVLQPNQISSKGLGPNAMTYNDDIFMGWLGIGPQIDGLGHIGVDHVYYNGHKDSDFAKADGLQKLGIEKLPPIVARGVLLDMAAYYGVDMVQEGTPYTKEDIVGAAEKQGVEIREGDVVLFHSGWLNLLDEGTRELARDQGYEFMFVLGPARMRGAVQMMINPTAIR